MSENEEINGNQQGKQKNIAFEDFSDEEEYKYQLVQFYQDETTELLDIDIIPTTWIIWDAKKRACMTKYPPPPYTAKVCEQLQRLVEHNKPPLHRWLWWTVEIKGGANTYKQGLERIEKLKTNTYAYTTDSNMDGPQKSQRTTTKLMNKSTKDLFDVSEINSIDDDWTPNVQDSPTSNSTESSVSSTTGTVSKKNSSFSKFHKKKFNEAKSVNINRPVQRLDKISVNPKKSKNPIGSKTDTLSCDTISISSGSNEYISKSNLGKQLTRIQTNKKDALPSIDASSSTDAPPSTDTPPLTYKSRETTKNIFEERFNIREQQLSPDTLFLVKIMKRFSIDLQANTAAINALHDAFLNKSVTSTKVTIEDIDKKYNLNLPFETQETFQEFDKNLQENQKMNEALILSLKQLLDRNNNVTKSMTNILRKFFSQGVITRFTAQKKVPNKTLLKETNFGRSLIAALVQFHTHQDGTPVNENDVLKCAGNAISNAKDWDGRKNRPHL